MTESELRRAVLETAVAMNRVGINRGAAGNVSARLADGFVITPTGMAYDASRPDDMVRMRLDGSASGPRRPSSEWRFHRDIYATRPEAGAIVHTHSPFATSLACVHREIPPFHYMIARFGGATVRCAEYATFGTQRLSDHVLKALEGRSACLMANHGMLVFASDLRGALDAAVELETLCEQYWRALQVAEPVLLDEAEMATVRAKFGTYGQQDEVSRIP